MVDLFITLFANMKVSKITFCVKNTPILLRSRRADLKDEIAFIEMPCTFDLDKRCEV